MNEESKPQLKSLFRNDPATPEGKYLVMRRDGTVVEWPAFVLGARDPIASYALFMYGKEVLRICHNEPEEAKRLNLTEEFGLDCIAESERWVDYRERHGAGDPGSGRHRKDDPATLEMMRKGRSA